jgi:Tripartite tricarboxylate transporter family receptor
VRFFILSKKGKLNASAQSHQVELSILHRELFGELSKVLGQPVNVEHKPGAGGNIGGVEAA